MRTKQIETVRQQFNDMIAAGRIPVLEYHIKPDDYIVVNIEATDRGIEFTFDENGYSVFFSSDIQQVGSVYILPYNEDYSLDSHLSQIDEEIGEGYMLANDIHSYDEIDNQ